MTLIEIILSMALIGIIAVTFLTVLVISLRLIVNAGNRTDAAYQAQSTADKQVANAGNTGTDSLGLTVSGVVGSVPVDGYYYEDTILVNGQNVTITIFVPNR
jgi:type II secretory pathway pseudopilin PulG